MTADDEGKLESGVVSELFAKHGDELRRFLYGVLRDSPLVDDALQSALAKMVDRGHQAQEESRKAWLFRVAYHEALLIRRRQATSDSALRRLAWISDRHVAAAEAPLIRSETVARVRAAVDALPADQRQIVRMRMYEQKTFAVIADELKIPLGTALSRMRAALAKLKTSLAEPD